MQPFQNFPSTQFHITARTPSKAQILQLPPDPEKKSNYQKIMRGIPQTPTFLFPSNKTDIQNHP